MYFTNFRKPESLNKKAYKMYALILLILFCVNYREEILSAQRADIEMRYTESFFSSGIYKFMNMCYNKKKYPVLRVAYGTANHILYIIDLCRRRSAPEADGGGSR